MNKFQEREKQINKKNCFDQMTIFPSSFFFQLPNCVNSSHLNYRKSLKVQATHRALNQKHSSASVRLCVCCILSFFLNPKFVRLMFVFVCLFICLLLLFVLLFNPKFVHLMFVFVCLFVCLLQFFVFLFIPSLSIC